MDRRAEVGILRRFTRPLYRAARTAAVASSFLFVFAVVAFAQDRPAPGVAPAAAGRFDFYVLALSWSPSFCAAAAEREPNRRPGPQCGGRPFSFVVHGLWPQFERGFPSYCQTPAPWVDRAVIDRTLDIMPSPGLVIHEWKRHGTCSGLSASAYFQTVRKARAVVKIPPAYDDLDKPIMVAPGEVAAAFLEANPGLSHAALAVACDSKRLSEVRVCLTKDFSFRDCPEVARRACRRDKVVMPAVRGG
jgi:ribonuclease T2